jgi:hypothetical protein
MTNPANIAAAPSLMRMSAYRRVMLAGVLVALLWAVVWWAML